MSIRKRPQTSRARHTMSTINTPLLIKLIKERPAIWDRTSEIYSDKVAKALAWKEICTLLNEDFEKMDYCKKRAFRALVIKKWGHTRDTWVRRFKKQLRGDDVLSRPYKYYESMLFLLKVTDTSAYESPIENKTIESNEEVQAEESEFDITQIEENLTYATQLPKIKSVSSDVCRETTINEPDTKIEYENRHLCFFKSIIPSMTSFDDDQTLEFQARTISLLQEMKKTIPPNNYYERVSAARSQSHTSGYSTLSITPASPSAESVVSVESNDDSDYLI